MIRVHRLIRVHPDQIQQFLTWTDTLLHRNTFIHSFGLHPCNIFTSCCQYKIFRQISTVDIIPESSSSSSKMSSHTRGSPVLGLQFLQPHSVDCNDPSKSQTARPPSDRYTHVSFSIRQELRTCTAVRSNPSSPPLPDHSPTRLLWPPAVAGHLWDKAMMGPDHPTYCQRFTRVGGWEKLVWTRRTLGPEQVHKTNPCVVGHREKGASPTSHLVIRAGSFSHSANYRFVWVLHEVLSESLQCNLEDTCLTTWHTPQDSSNFSPKLLLHAPQHSSARQCRFSNCL